MLTGTKINKSYLVLLCFFTASYDSLNSLWHGHTLLMIRISSAGSNQLKKKNHFYHTAVGYIITATIGWSEHWLSCYYGICQGVGYVRQQVNTQLFRSMCMSMGLIRALSVLYIFYGESASRIDMTFWFRRRGFEIRGRKFHGRKFHGVKIDPRNSHSNELDVESVPKKTAIWTLRLIYAS